MTRSGTSISTFVLSKSTVINKKRPLEFSPVELTLDRPTVKKSLIPVLCCIPPSIYPSVWTFVYVLSGLTL